MIDHRSWDVSSIHPANHTQWIKFQIALTCLAPFIVVTSQVRAFTLVGTTVLFTVGLLRQGRATRLPAGPRRISWHSHLIE